jgi:hypothetical protein
LGTGQDPEEGQGSMGTGIPWEGQGSNGTRQGPRGRAGIHGDGTWIPGKGRNPRGQGRDPDEGQESMGTGQRFRGKGRAPWGRDRIPGEGQGSMRNHRGTPEVLPLGPLDSGWVTCKVSGFMYRRPILCTLYGAVDFLNVLKKYIMYL